MSIYRVVLAATSLFVIVLLLGGKQASQIASIQKIYIGSFGHSDDAERLVVLLKQELSKRNFIVVGDKNDADGLLSGIITVQQLSNRTEAHATATLEDSIGNVLWTGDFGGNFHFGNDAVRWRASDIAKSLEKARRKARK